MTIVVEYDIDTAQAERFFDYAGYKTRSTSQPISAVKRLMEDIVHEQWATEGGVFPSPGLGAWEPLADATIERKGHDTILVETHRLKDAAESGVHSGQDWVQYRVDRETDDGYSLVELHQHGAGKMPSRPLWETTGYFEDQVQLIFWEWLYELKSTNARRRTRPNDVAGLSIIPSYREF